MSVIMTAAGEALKARLQAEGKPLVIDTFVFAHIPNLDPTEQLTPGITVPTEQVVYTYPIPDEYRAYVNPNQVVYSALLGSDVGDWSFNWQGLVCSEYDTLIAAATFPTLEKRKYSGATGRQQPDPQFPVGVLRSKGAHGDHDQRRRVAARLYDPAARHG